MKNKLKYIVLLSAISLILISCNSTNKGIINNDIEVGSIKNKIKSENENLIYNPNGSKKTLEDLKIYSVKDTSGEVYNYADARFNFNEELLDDKAYNSITVEEIINKTLDQANRKDNYTIGFKGIISRTIDDGEKTNYSFSNLHQQNDEGNFRVIYEEHDPREKEQKVGRTSYNVEEYTCFELKDTNPDDFVKSLPSDLSQKEVLEILKQHHFGKSSENIVIKGKNLQELKSTYNNIIIPAIEDSLFYLDLFNEGFLEGSFVRLEDGYKNYENKLLNNDVYHILYICRNEDPELSVDFEFFIDKDTYLITFQYGEYMGHHYESELSYYDTEYINLEIDYDFSDIKMTEIGFININEINDSRNSKFKNLVSENLTNKDELEAPKDLYIILNEEKYLKFDNTLEELENLIDGGEIKELGEDEYYENVKYYSIKNEGIMVIFVDNSLNNDLEFIKIEGIYITNSKHSTYRGLRVGDTYDKMIKLYNDNNLNFKQNFGTDTIYSYSNDELTDFLQLMFTIDNKTKLITEISVSETF